MSSNNQNTKNIDYEKIRRILQIPPEDRDERIIQELYNEIRLVPYFERYHNMNYGRIVKKALRNFRIVTFKHLWTIFEANSMGDYFFVLLRGKIGVFVPRTLEEQDLIKKRYYDIYLTPEKKQLQEHLMRGFNVQKEQLEKQLQDYKDAKKILMKIETPQKQLRISQESFTSNSEAPKYYLPTSLHHIKDEVLDNSTSFHSKAHRNQFSKSQDKYETEEQHEQRIKNIENSRPDNDISVTPKNFEVNQSRFTNQLLDKIHSISKEQLNDSIESDFTEQEKNQIKQHIIIEEFHQNMHPDEPELNPKTIFKNIEDLLTHHKQVAYVQEGTAFGEVALLFDKQRSAACVALEDSQILVLEKKLFQLTLKPKEMEKIHDNMSFVYNHPLFSEFDRLVCCMIYLNTVELKVTKNTKIFNEGEEADSVYLIKRGEFAIEKTFQEEIVGKLNTEEKDKKKKAKKIFQNQFAYKICIMGEGHLIGEETYLYSDQLRQYSLRCDSQEGIVIKILNSDFKNRIMSNNAASTYIKSQSEKKINLLKKHFQRIREQIKQKYDDNNTEDEGRESFYAGEVIKNFVMNKKLFRKIKQQRKGRLLQQFDEQQQQGLLTSQLKNEYNLITQEKQNDFVQRQQKIKGISEQIPTKMAYKQRLIIGEKKQQKLKKKALRNSEKNQLENLEKSLESVEEELPKKQIENYRDILDNNVFYMERFFQGDHIMERRMNANFLKYSNKDQVKKMQKMKEKYKADSAAKQAQPAIKKFNTKVDETHKMLMEKFKIIQKIKNMEEALESHLNPKTNNHEQTQLSRVQLLKQKKPKISSDSISQTLIKNLEQEKESKFDMLGSPRGFNTQRMQSITEIKSPKFKTKTESTELSLISLSKSKLPPLTTNRYIKAISQSVGIDSESRSVDKQNDIVNFINLTQRVNNQPFKSEHVSPRNDLYFVPKIKNNQILSKNSDSSQIKDQSQNNNLKNFKDLSVISPRNHNSQSHQILAEFEGQPSKKFIKQPKYINAVNKIHTQNSLYASEYYENLPQFPTQKTMASSKQHISQSRLETKQSITSQDLLHQNDNKFDFETYPKKYKTTKRNNDNLIQISPLVTDRKIKMN